MLFKNIKAIAKSKSLTISQLERECGFYSGTIDKWKRTKPSYDRLITVSNRLDCSVDDLIKGEAEWTKGASA